VVKGLMEIFVAANGATLYKGIKFYSQIGYLQAILFHARPNVYIYMTGMCKVNFP
jgi:hypothetical protein